MKHTIIMLMSIKSFSQVINKLLCGKEFASNHLTICPTSISNANLSDHKKGCDTNLPLTQTEVAEGTSVLTKLRALIFF